MSPFKLALAELRRFRGRSVRVAALAAMILIPLVYGGLYLWFAWDPYGSLDEMPVAVVNADTGATIERNGESTDVNGGEQLVDQLKGDRIFDWRFTDAAAARHGLEDGDYYMVITVPEDFSTKLASLAGTDPDQAEVKVDLNDANGHVAGVMASTVERELQNQIDTAVYVTFAKTLFGDLAELGVGLADAETGAVDLADGIGDTQTGLVTLHSGLSDLSDDAHDVSDAADQVSSGVDQVIGVAQPVVDGLAENWDQIQAGSAAGSNLVNDAATGLDDAYTALCEDDEGEPAACTALKEHLDRADEVNTDVQTANGSVQATSTDTLENASEDLATLQTGASDVATGAREVATSASSAETGAGELADGLGELHDGAAGLGEGLASAVARIPPTDPTDNADNAEVYGSPVAIDENNLNPADNYGRGLAPLSIAIALWVFGIVAYLLLRPANPRALAGPLSSPLIAIGGWMPGAILGVAGALVLYLVLDVALGLDPEHVTATIALCVLAILAFSAMAHLFKLAAGAAGSLLIVVLLMLQLTSAGGLYPVETTPAFFQAIHPWLPMTYVVDALRVTITGGETAHLTRAVAVLGAYLLASLALASTVVATRRKWRTDTLNPPLKL
ncbi:YhgE/Pip domain-containing protein [Glycomyces sp. L485]|uniref:YhgE/Pip domain-containing protein n=1 Tax=Glycomyces sp. L485 TaxID=2909235 RepID=UPI001F4B3D2E|nr:YhgE/Pip domain-containing protein [Glycomyces sp. L485]MCH7231870.1 YhgE/Pip domain-containing protein [Glycomyces sp. L485]